MSDLPRIVVLISGGGTNLQALIDSIKAEQFEAEIVAVISNRPDVLGLERASRAGIATEVLDHRNFGDRDSFDAELMQRIDRQQPDLIVLAGFMRILTTDFVRRYEGKMLNIHPSLLPKYRGLHTHERALEAGDDYHGVTVHFVTEELDGGPLVIQAIVPIERGDTPGALARRVQAQEHIIYPLAVKWFCEGRLNLKEGLVHMDSEPLPATGCQLDTRA